MNFGRSVASVDGSVSTSVVMHQLFSTSAANHRRYNVFLCEVAMNFTLETT